MKNIISALIVILSTTSFTYAKDQVSTGSGQVFIMKRSDKGIDLIQDQNLSEEIFIAMKDASITQKIENGTRMIVKRSNDGNITCVRTYVQEGTFDGLVIWGEPTTGCTVTVK